MAYKLVSLASVGVCGSDLSGSGLPGSDSSGCALSSVTWRRGVGSAFLSTLPLVLSGKVPTVMKWAGIMAAGRVRPR